MGNISYSSNQTEAQTEFKHANQRISNEVESYLDFIFETSSVIDIDIIDLDKSLNSVIVSFNECMKKYGSNSCTFETAIQEHCNLQKHSVRKMFHFINESHEHFIESLSVIMEPDYGERIDDKTEDDLLFEARKYCQKILEDYEAEIKTDPFFPNHILSNRSNRLRKLLFKDLELLLQDFTTLSIANRKEWLLNIIDELLRVAIKNHKSTGASSPTFWRDQINEIIDVSNYHIDMLSSIPLSNVTLIDQAVRDINIHVRNIIRTIQIFNSNQGEVCLDIIFDNKLDTTLNHMESAYAELADTDDVSPMKAITTKAPKINKSNKINSKRNITETIVLNDESDDNDDVNVKVANKKCKNKSETAQVDEKPLKTRKIKK